MGGRSSFAASDGPTAQHGDIANLSWHREHPMGGKGHRVTQQGFGKGPRLLAQDCAHGACSCCTNHGAVLSVGCVVTP